MDYEGEIDSYVNFHISSSNMSLPSEKISEKNIIAMLQANNPLPWVNLYDKYASAMFGLICNLTEDKLLAEEIFVNAFRELKQKQIL